MGPGRISTTGRFLRRSCAFIPSGLARPIAISSCASVDGPKNCGSISARTLATGLSTSFRRPLPFTHSVRDYTSLPGARPENQVAIWVTGAAVVAAIEAAESLVHDGVYARVINRVSPGLVHQRWKRKVHDAMVSMARPLAISGQPPVVTVVDGHPSALSWVGSMLGVPSLPLGVTDYGQSGLPDELHRHFQIDADSISYAAFAALDGAAGG